MKSSEFDKHRKKATIASIKACQKPILQLDLKGNFIKEWPSGTDVSKALNIPLSNISKVCSEERNHAGGFKFKYK